MMTTSIPLPRYSRIDPKTINKGVHSLGFNIALHTCNCALNTCVLIQLVQLQRRSYEPTRSSGPTPSFFAAARHCNVRVLSRCSFAGLKLEMSASGPPPLPVEWGPRAARLKGSV